MCTANLCLSLGSPIGVLGVDETIETLLGYHATDLLSGVVVFWDLVHRDDQDIADMLCATNALQSVGDFNIRLRQANGRIRCIRGRYRREAGLSGPNTVLNLRLQDAKGLVNARHNQNMMVNFKAMMESSDDYIYFKDRNHVFTGASQTLVALTSPIEHWTDLIGLTDYDVFPEEYADIYYRLEKQVFAGIPVAREIQKTREKNGKEGWVDNRKYPIYGDSGELLGLFGVARDITEMIAAQEALQAQHTQLQTLEAQHLALLTNLHTGIVVHAPDTRIVFSNPSASRLLGLTEDQMRGKTAIDPTWCFLDQDGHAMLVESYPVNVVLQTHAPISDWVIGVQQPGNHLVWLSVNAFPDFDPSGALKQVVVNFEDITARRNAELELQKEANFDQLTQLPNRRLFMDRLSQALKRSHREKTLTALMFMDLDHFKEVNDSLGHDVGDMLLVQVAQRLRQCVRDFDTVGRLGGDEFVIVLSDLQDVSHVERVARQVLARLSEPFCLSDTPSLISGSIGVAIYPSDATTALDLIKCADHAMYLSKDAGRNCFRFFASKAA